MKIIGIYKIISPSGNIYIGQSIDCVLREKQYRIINCKTQHRLYNSIKKYGWEHHKFEIIHQCEEVMLNHWEIYYIYFFDTFNTEHGLNLMSGGDKFRHAEETKEKMRIAAKGNKNGMGHIVTESHKEILREKQIGKKFNHSIEVRNKMSQTRKGKEIPWLKNKTPWNKGKKGIMDSTRHKMRLAKVGRAPWNKGWRKSYSIVNSVMREQAKRLTSIYLVAA